MNLVPRKFFLDDLFDDFVPEVSRTNNMKCDIYEKDGNYVVEMDIPGFSKDDIDINVEKGYLTITASKENETNDEGKNYIRRERSYGKFQRQFYMGDVNEDEINAEFTNGILKVMVPKKEEVNTKKKIEIK